MRFTQVARLLADAARQLDLVAPGFRSPPRIVGLDRTLRRSLDGVGGVVAVRLRGRPFIAVLSDMIEGVLVVNRLAAPEADHVRSHLWRVVFSDSDENANQIPNQNPDLNRSDSHRMPIAHVA